MKIFWIVRQNLSCYVFLINFLEEILKREIKHEEIWSDFVAEQNEERSKRERGFFSYRFFLESEKLRSEKKICKRAKFFVHVRHFKAVSFPFLVKKFG